MRPNRCIERDDWSSVGTQQDGAAGVEYGILLGGVAALIITVAFAVGYGVEDMFATFGAEFSELNE